VSVVFDGPQGDNPLLFLAHGAGNDMRAEFMTTMASLLAENGLRVCRFNFAYAERGRRSPDRQSVLEETFESVVAEVRDQTGKVPVFLGGKSLGGRIASQVVASGLSADGLVFLGYPLHPPGRPERLRNSHLLGITVPMLFVEGTRDPFCPLDTLEKVRSDLVADTRVAVINDGDHSLKVRKSSGRTTQDAWREAAAAVADWASRVS
jgi:uncharacterized protein